MKCPYCEYEEDRVVDSRVSREGRAIRRRRECVGCGERFTTYEYIENQELTIIKSDQRREEYDRQKLLGGLIAACKKRPIGIKKIESIVDKIEHQIDELGKIEIPSSEIGNMVMTELYALDEIAYVRFASVYRKFKDVSEFISEVQGIGTATNTNTKKD